MKSLSSILGLIIFLLMFSCGGSSESSEEQSGIYEPKTQEQFVQILNDIGIKPYPGAVITNFEEGSNSEMTYSVPSEGITNKAILDYYTAALENGLKDNPDWKKFMNTPVSVIYMKGFDLTFSVTITSANAAMEMAGSTDNIPENLTYMIALGDDSVSY